MIKRIWNKIEKTKNCWNWTACIISNGYGQVRYNGRMQYAHRVVYELLVGEIPEGLQIDHLCRNRACVNPDHLEPVTLKENVLRGEGMSAKNARKTHCKNGHLLEKSNLLKRKEKQRCCRTCWNKYSSEYKKESNPPNKP